MILDYQTILKLKLNLRKLILISTILSVSLLFISSIFVLNYLIKDQLIKNSLFVNQNYADKIANSINYNLKNMMSELDYSANEIGKSFDDQKIINNEIKKLKFQSKQFNSIFVIDKDQKLISYSPPILNLELNKKYITPGVQNSIHLKDTYISSPYLSVKNNLIVMLSKPIYDDNAKYLGFIGGTIYLQKDNLINEILSTQLNIKKSYMYVIDDKDRIIFHPDKKRIGEKILNNTGLDYIKKHKNGSIRLINSRGVDNLAGFAYIPHAHWIIVSQQPTNELLAEVDSVIQKIFIALFLFYIIIFIIIWKTSSLISRPLNDLAHLAGVLTNDDVKSKITEVKPWYFETSKFKDSLLLSSDSFLQKMYELKRISDFDPLTTLYNRRGMKNFIDHFVETRTIFSVIAIDIDHFKKINDTYGHDRGDEVLRTLSKIMKQSFRETDVCCRIGGEEFIVLIPETHMDNVLEITKRFHKKVERFVFDEINHLTVSIGVSFWMDQKKSIDDIFKEADQKLYEAKKNGRNCIRF